MLIIFLYIFLVSTLNAGEYCSECLSKTNSCIYNCSYFEGFFAGLAGNIVAVPKCSDKIRVGCGGWLDISFLGSGLINKKKNWYVGLEGGPSITKLCDKTITLANFGIQCGFIFGKSEKHLIYFLVNMIGAPIFATANFIGGGYAYAFNESVQFRTELSTPCSGTFIGFSFPVMLPTARFKLGLYLNLF